ncbi:MAG: UDP-N-acetylglucosamine 1-carboxyvinyltransferase [Patescibacteria group bacterium]
MAQFRITGQQPIRGTIAVDGAKNHALKVIAASLLSKEEMLISRMPNIGDVRLLLDILEAMGAKVRADLVKQTAAIDTSTVKHGAMPTELVRGIRASAVLMGPLLARFGEVTISHPGGCVLGRRPIDIFLDGFRAMGAKVRETGDTTHCTAKRLRGGRIFMPQVSVTATETLMMAAVLAEGTTVLENAACEPEIPELAAYLNRHGAKIRGAGTPSIRIDGVKKIGAGACAIMPDRLETGTFAILAAAARGNLRIEQCNPAYVGALWALFDRMGVPYTCGDDWVEVNASGKKPFTAVNLKTHEYPGFATDLQAPMTVLLTQCRGLSMVHETIFEGRLFYVDKLNRMGANVILCDPHRAIVQGPTKLRGKSLESPDIRAGMALVIAALIARGETVIDNIQQVERGYANVAERLRSLGAQIERVG